MSFNTCPQKVTLRTAELPPTVSVLPLWAPGLSLPFAYGAADTSFATGEGSPGEPEPVGSWARWRSGAERAGAVRPLHGASPGAAPLLGALSIALHLAAARRRPSTGDASWRLPQGAGAQPPPRGWATIAMATGPRSFRTDSSPQGRQTDTLIPPALPLPTGSDRCQRADPAGPPILACRRGCHGRRS